MTSAEELLASLDRHGVTHVVGLTDSRLAHLFALLEGPGRPRLVRVTREGEAFAIAAGLWLGGMTPVVAIQSTGLLESGDALRGTAQRMEVPLVTLVRSRGHATLERSGARTATALTRPDVDSVALLLEPTLDAWRIPYRTVAGPGGGARANETSVDETDGETSAEAVAWAFETADAERTPVAVVLT